MFKKVLVLLLLPVISIGCKADDLNLNIRYDQVHGLKKGDQVIFKQHPIGTVTGVSYRDNGDYLASIAIEKDSNAVATEHSRFFIADDPLRQGHKAVEVSQIRPGGLLLKNRATVEGSTRASVFFDQMKSGFEKGLDELKQKLFTGGSPATLSELKIRFDEYLASVSKGKDVNKIRIVLE